MRCGLAVIGVLIAGCSFGGSPPGGPDADRSRPDAPPGTPDGPVADAPPGTPDAPPDAMLPDAPPPFSPDLCPASYDLVIGGILGSRYRFIATAAPFATQYADCNDDHPGWTHLIAVDVMGEAIAVGQENTTGYSYVGVVQQPGQTTLTAGWFLLTGGAPTTGWSPASGGQPNDGDGVEDGAENLAVVASTGNMHDVTGVNAYTAACECDGLPVDPTVATYIP